MKEVSYYFRFLAEQKKKSNEQCIYIKNTKKEEEKKPQTQTKQTKARS